MSLCAHIKSLTDQIVLPYLILFAQFFEKIHKVLISELGEEIGTQMTHAPSTLQVQPWSLFIRPRVSQFLYCTQYTCMPVMKDAHIRLILHNCYFKLPEEPCPTFNVLPLHKSKCKWDNLILTILTNSGQDLTLVLAGQKSTIYTYHRSAMNESFYANTEREEQSMQNFHSGKLWHEKVLDVDICAWIPPLQCLKKPHNRVICIKI